MRNVLDESYRENENTHFMFNNVFFRKLHRLWDNVEKYDGAWRGGGHKWRNNMAHTHCMLHKRGYMHARTRSRSRVPIRTHAHAHPDKYVIPIAFPRQQWFHERACVTLYVHCLSCYDIWSSRSDAGCNLKLEIQMFCFITLYCWVSCPRPQTFQVLRTYATKRATRTEK
jgi:hypothetical protein